MTRSRAYKLVVGVGLLAAVAAVPFATEEVQADSRRPSQDDIDFAIETMDLLQAELIAALLQEFDETTPQNVEQGKAAISLIFADSNPALRLIGEIDPLRENDLPQDAFERQSLARAMTGLGNEAVQKVKGKYYLRRSVPLSNFSPACVMCHAAFGPTDAEQWVGALIMRVPTTRDDQ